MTTDQLRAFSRYCYMRARFADITHLARDFAEVTLCGRPTYGSPLREVGGPGRHVCPRCAAVAASRDN